MREWPASERCLALDSCRRRLSLASAAPRRHCAEPVRARMWCRADPFSAYLCDETRRGMTVRSIIDRITQHEGLNFLLTNRIPRRLATSFVGWFSRIEQPIVRDLSIRIWRLFCDLDLSEAKETHFKSLRDCFIRELKDGARPVDADPGVLVSPCDAIVGAGGDDRRHGAAADQGLRLFAGGAAARSRPRGVLPRRLLRDAAADGRHVPPLSRAARLRGGARHAHLGRCLERQSDRAEARQEAVLQERARA